MRDLLYPEKEVFFSSDFHLDHGNITGPSISNWKDGYRDFETIERMNTTIIEAINDTVAQDAILYFLGDFCFRDHRQTPYWRDRIVCQNMVWLAGNHDKKQKLYRNKFDYCGDYIKITKNKQPICMSHYKPAIWEGSHKGFWYLYGHSHASAEDWVIGKSMDVGIDNAKILLGEYRPFSFEEIKGFMSKREINFVDHHGKNTDA